VRSIVSISCSRSFISLLRLWLSAWESPWIFESFYAYTIWLFIRRSMHTSLHRALFGCLSRSFSRTLPLPLSLSPFPKYACSSCLFHSHFGSLSLAITSIPSTLPPDSIPLSLLYSLPPSLLSRFSPPTLSSCPQPSSLDFIRTRAYLCTYPYWYIYIDTKDVIKWEWGVFLILWIII